jgi:hypothetical protein
LEDVVGYVLCVGSVWTLNVIGLEFM